MRTIEVTARVNEDGTLTVRVPPDVTPGEHRVVLVIEEQVARAATIADAGSADQVDSSEGTLSAAERQRRFIEDWPVHHVGHWPAGLSLRREDMYGDDGR